MAQASPRENPPAYCRKKIGLAHLSERIAVPYFKKLGKKTEHNFRGLKRHLNENEGKYV
jgi:hypothetical protein